MLRQAIELSPRPAESGPRGAGPLGMWIAVTGLAAVFGYLLIYHYHHESKEKEVHLGDFPTFYMAAEFARVGRDIYTAGTPPKQMYVYPPLVAFLYVPLTALPKIAAAHLSLVLNTAMLFASLLLAARTVAARFGAHGSTVVLMAAFAVSVLNENEMRNELTMLETDAMMLLTFTLALCWLERIPILAGLALAFAFNIKYLAILILPYLILRRRWKAAGAMVAGSIAFALLPALLLGWNEDLRCLQVAFGGLLKWVHVTGTPAAPGTGAAGHTVQIHDIGDNLSLSITSAIARMLGENEVSDPAMAAAAHAPVSNVAVLAAAGGVGLVTLALVALMYRLNGFSLWRSARASAPPSLVALEWAGLITAALIFSPDTNTRHLLLAILVNMVGVMLVLTPQPVSRVPVLIALAIIVLSLVMPVHSLRIIFFRYGIPCWGLLAGYLLILWTGLKSAACRVRCEV